MKTDVEPLQYYKCTSLLTILVAGQTSYLIDIYYYTTLTLIIIRIVILVCANDSRIASSL